MKTYRFNLRCLFVGLYSLYFFGTYSFKIERVYIYFLQVNIILPRRSLPSGKFTSLKNRKVYYTMGRVYYHPNRDPIYK